MHAYIFVINEHLQSIMSNLKPTVNVPGQRTDLWNQGVWIMPVLMVLLYQCLVYCVEMTTESSGAKI